MKRGILFFLAFVVGISALLQRYKTSFAVDGPQQTIQSTKDVSLNQFLSLYKEGTFRQLEVVDNQDLKGYHLLNTSTKGDSVDLYQTKKPADVSLVDLGISLTGKVPVDVQFHQESFLEKMFSEIGPMLIFLVVFLFLLKFMMPKGGMSPFAIKIGKLDNKQKNKTRFIDVAGMEEVKNELSEIVDYLKHPQKYQKVGARHPKGVLLYGEPGSGKTLLARAVAGESDVPFFSVSGSEFMEMLVGMGAAKVRELFAKAKAVGKAIIFIDEIDAIGRRRGVGYTGGHQEQEQTLNQILTEMDGFDNTTNIIVMAATNRPDILDPALLRAGRFDRKIVVSRPTYEERVMIFEYYLKTKKYSKQVSLESLAKRTIGLVGADIENIVNEASLKVAKENKTVIDVPEFEYALEKVLMGPEKKGKSMNEQEKKIVAYHELGHALTAYFLPLADPVEKISIVRRGQALGMTWMTPEEDSNLYSKAKFLDQVVSLLGGRAAEEIFFGEDYVTTGASNDFEKATSIVYDMLVKYGMDSELGTILYDDHGKEEYKPYKSYSEKTAQLIDEKVKKYITESYTRAKSLITTHQSVVESLSRDLLEREYLTKEEFVEKIERLSKSTK